MLLTLSDVDVSSHIDGNTLCISHDSIVEVINPFFPNAPFLYPLKISENPALGTNGLKDLKMIQLSKWFSKSHANKNKDNYCLIASSDKLSTLNGDNIETKKW